MYVRMCYLCIYVLCMCYVLCTYIRMYVFMYVVYVCMCCVLCTNIRIYVLFMYICYLCMYVLCIMYVHTYVLRTYARTYIYKHVSMYVCTSVYVCTCNNKTPLVLTISNHTLTLTHTHWYTISIKQLKKLLSIYDAQWRTLFMSQTARQGCAICTSMFIYKRVRLLQRTACAHTAVQSAEVTLITTDWPHVDFTRKI